MVTKTSAHINTRSVPEKSSATKAGNSPESAAKRDVGKLVKAILNGLEDVKAQNIEVFDTEHLSSLFERVIVASGTSNRQTKALAASVRDAVRDAGFVKPRMEGEDNGEWIIVDCGAAVAHIMQPAIRQYYHLEDIWGEKPMRLKSAAEKKPPESIPAAKKAPISKTKASKTPVETAQTATKKVASKKTVLGKTAAAKTPVSKKPSSQAPAKKAPAKKAVAKKAPAKKSAAKKSA